MKLYSTSFGLILMVTVFDVAIWRVLRRVAAWQQDRVIIQAHATLWAPGVTALVVVVPVLLAQLLSQYPAPGY